MSSTAVSFANRLLQIKLYSKFLFRVFLMIFGLQCVAIIIFNGWFNSHWEDTKTVLEYGWDLTLTAFSNWNFEEGAKLLFKTCGIYFDDQKWIVLASFSCWLTLPWMLTVMHVKDKDKTNNREYIQGRQHLTHQALMKLLFKKSDPSTCLPLGELALPFVDENKQTFAVGKPGCGKTNAFNQMILKILDLNRKAIIHDYKGDYVEKFYNPIRDILFNPLDERSVGWCLFNDCTSIMDLDAFAEALIPEATTGDPFWNDAARKVFSAILRYCWQNNLRTNKDIWRVATAPNESLYELFLNAKGCEVGAAYLQDPNGKTANGIMSNMLTYAAVFEYMQHMDGSFSITKWVENNDKNGLIFVTNYARLQNTLQPMISLFIQTAGNALLSLSDDINRRMYMVLDEFGQLPKMNTIISLMTASRSKGGAVMIGIQDVGQIDKTYKHETRKTILNSTANRLIFNCKDRETAKLFSEEIGETEYYEILESQSLGMNQGDRVNTSKQRRKEFLVTPEDIQSLPDLHAFVSIGHWDIALSKWDYKVLPSKSQAFIQRPELNLSVVLDVIPFDPNNIAHKETPVPVNTVLDEHQPEEEFNEEVLNNIYTNKLDNKDNWM